MLTKPPLVSIVVLNWNGLEDTKLCLDSIRKLDYANYEIIVVDNGSNRNDKAWLAKQKDIIYIDNPVNRGFTGGHIDGYRQARGEFILLLNNDAVIAPDYVAKALPLFADPQIAAVGGRSYFWNESSPLFDTKNLFYSYMNVNVYSAETTPLMEDLGMIQDVNSVSGSAVIIRRSALDKVGYLYEPFFAYYEETDLFARMQRAGYRIVYNPELGIWHQNGASSGSKDGSYFFYFQIFRNRFAFAFRNFEYHYLIRFLKNYYVAGVQAILDTPNGPSQQRLGMAYMKAMIINTVRIMALLANRRTLTKQLGKTAFCKQALRNQVQLSIVVDATHCSVTDLKQLSTNVAADQNPLHEYVLVVRTSQESKLPRLNKNARFVIDREYFDVHSINLGCIAARMGWMVVGDKEIIKSVPLYHERIAEGSLSGNQALVCSPNSIALTKSYYQLVGGFQESKSSLRANLDYMRKYAAIDHKLPRTEVGDMSLSESEKKRIQSEISYNSVLFRSRHGGRWQRYLQRHYRLYQLNNLLTWLCNPSIPVRLKLARIKNLIMFTATAKRAKLATELRHIKNETLLYSRKFSGAAKIGRQQQAALADATNTLSHQLHNVPVFLICFERLNDMKKLVSWLKKRGVTKIIFVDNASTYPPLLAYYDHSPYQVIKLERNVGHTALWNLDIIRILVPSGYYIVSDPDILPSQECPSDVIAHLADIHAKFPAYNKVGLGLETNNLPDYYPLKQEVIRWEKQFWQTPVAPDIYEAGVDTTFALYKPFTYNYQLHPSLRTGEPYTARHLPWYIDPRKPDSEETYYRAHANKNVTSWNVDELPERYKKEIN